MRRLLLVAYFYPPLAGAGVFRPLRLSKYLVRRGWEVTVLTASSRSRVLQDRSLLADVPPKVRVERVWAPSPRLPLLALSRLGLGSLRRRLQPFLMLPDEERAWVPFAVARARALHRRTPFSLVLTTSSPQSAHLAGLALQHRPGLPWVADFRDEWSSNPYLRQLYPSDWHRRYNLALERRVLSRAERVVCVSEPWLEALRQQVPDQPAGKFVTIPNGFDGEHFATPPPPRPERFRVLYAGTFYGHRKPDTFLDGVRVALERGWLAGADLEVVLAGHRGPEDRLGALPEPIYRVLDHQPYFESLGLLRGAAVLLLVVPRAGGPGNHTGKLFPYLASKVPILALAPEPNVAADLVRSSGSGVVVPPDDPEEVARALGRLYQRWQSGRWLADQDEAMVRAYEARAQTAVFADLFEAVLAEREVAPERSGR